MTWCQRQAQRMIFQGTLIEGDIVEGRPESPASQQRNRNSGVSGFALATLICLLSFCVAVYSSAFLVRFLEVPDSSHGYEIAILTDVFVVSLSPSS